MAGLIDYAGLFPPAGLSMHDAVANYSSYRFGSDAWALGRFVVPSSRLGELEESLDAVSENGQKSTPWSISALLTSGDIAEMNLLLEFNRRHGEATARVDSVEMKAVTPEEVRRIGRSATGRFAVYCEFPINDALPGLITAAAETGVRAKVRTGGVVPEAIPSTADVVRFLYACSTRRLPFKATAGLHHAVRGAYHLTYEPDSPSGVMNGFLNLFSAAAFLVEGMDLGDAMKVIEETDAAEFRFDDAGLTWRSHHLPLDRLSLARRGFAIAFGSCSFIEPVSEMKAINLI